MAEKTEYMEKTEGIANDEIGNVMIADDVIAVIAAYAATEVKGVASISGHITNDMVGKLGRKNLQKGVTIKTEDGEVTVDISLYLEYGNPIPKVCTAVQDRVKTSIETMTGLKVKEVNLQVAGVNVENS